MLKNNTSKAAFARETVPQRFISSLYKYWLKTKQAFLDKHSYFVSEAISAAAWQAKSEKPCNGTQKLTEQNRTVQYT